LPAGFEIEGHEATVYGRCASCAAQLKRPSQVENEI
jgi:Fe2+ or Zn2+ uptake regulation protein